MYICIYIYKPTGAVVIITSPPAKRTYMYMYMYIYMYIYIYVYMYVHK